MGRNPPSGPRARMGDGGGGFEARLVMVLVAAYFTCAMGVLVVAIPRRVAAPAGLRLYLACLFQARSRPTSVMFCTVALLSAAAWPITLLAWTARVQARASVIDTRVLLALHGVSTPGRVPALTRVPHEVDEQLLAHGIALTAPFETADQFWARHDRSTPHRPLPGRRGSPARHVRTRGEGVDRRPPAANRPGRPRRSGIPGPHATDADLS